MKAYFSFLIFFLLSQYSSTTSVNVRARSAKKATSTANSRLKALAEFCWRDSYGRGVGSVPSGCASNEDRIGLLCYTKCPSGMSRFGFDCHSNCPNGWRDDGLFCRLAEYGRGAGYPWKFGDGLNDNGMFSRCQADNGKGNCEKYGAIVYPKCKSGYSNVGCCICRPNTPKCSDFNLNSGIDLSCAKKIIIGVPTTGTCGGGQEKSAGLCYPSCNTGYSGVGPVCWGQPPSGWVVCGMGAATTTTKCATIIIGQVASVATIALNIATLGGSSAATAGAKTERLTQLKNLFASLKKIYDENQATFQQAQDLIKDALTIKKSITSLNDAISLGKSDDVTAEDIARTAAEIAAVLDPTGIAGAVAAYTYAKCSKLV